MPDDGRSKKQVIFLDIMVTPEQAASILNCHSTTVLRRIKSGTLQAELTINTRNRPQYRIPLAAFPYDKQAKYYEQHGLTLSAPEKTALQKVKPSPVQRPLDSYTDADRDKIGFWQDVVD